MRAAVVDGHGMPLRLVDLPVPAPGPGEILIKLLASGVCHSDVHGWRGDSVASPLPDPYILGHEGVGIVAAVGEGVRKSGPPFASITTQGAPAEVASMAAVS